MFCSYVTLGSVSYNLQVATSRKVLVEKHYKIFVMSTLPRVEVTFHFSLFVFPLCAVVFVLFLQFARQLVRQ